MRIPRDIDNLHTICPDPQHLEHSDPVIKLGRMTDDDAMMLDDWEEEGKRGEREHGKHIPEIFRFRFCFPFLARSACRIDARRCLVKEVCNNGLVNWGRREQT